MSELRDDNKTINPEIVNELPGEREVEDPARTLSLTRTKAYTKKLLHNVDVKELIRIVTSQTQLLILALGEHSLKLIEELDSSTDAGLRATLHEQLEKTIARSGDVARKKNELLTAIGYDSAAISIDADGRPIANLKKTTIGKDQFESMFNLNPFASVSDAEFEKSKSVVEALLTPDEKAKLDHSIKDAAEAASKRLRSVDDSDRLN